ncbi:MAG: HAD-IIIA family hydrolase [Proteobacteria bacterium]|jgi:phosphoglycolate phosphatase|nr:HAD-IA family hydrolase [Alphaproteobacteria bacterium]NCC02618.1 HAD-IIIA family hydrolase [Pseudomonadota bacterium]
MQRLEAIIFDLEGTILNSRVDLRQGLNLMLADEGRQPLSEEQVKGCMAEGIMETCQHALEQSGGLPSGDIYPYVKKYIGHIRTMPPDPEQVYPHVRDTLTSLHDRGIKLAICTNKSEEATTNQLKTLGLASYFDFIAGGDTFTVHKPNPGHVKGVLDALGVRNEGTVFVGDSMNDVLASKNAGVKCIIITHGELNIPVAMSVDSVITEFTELEASIKKLGFTLE